MKIIKYRYPRLSLPSRLSANQTHLPPPLKKKALLIGIQSIRQEAVEIAQEDDDERTAEKEDVNAIPKRKKKEKQKDKEEAPKAAGLKGPHRDVFQMKELLIGTLYHDIIFSFCLKEGIRRLPL
jgi:hypothetical protein